MKIYVASSLNNRENAAALIAWCKEHGHEITYDWTVHGRIDPSERERIVSIATDELNGVLNCETLLLLLPGRFGSHIELGAALAADKRVFIIGFEPEMQSSSFYYLPRIKHIKDLDTMKHMIAKSWVGP